MCVVLVSTNYYPHIDFCALLKASPFYGRFSYFNFISLTQSTERKQKRKKGIISTQRMAQMYLDFFSLRLRYFVQQQPTHDMVGNILLNERH